MFNAYLTARFNLIVYYSELSDRVDRYCDAVDELDRVDASADLDELERQVKALEVDLKGFYSVEKYFISAGNKALVALLDR